MLVDCAGGGRIILDGVDVGPRWRAKANDGGARAEGFSCEPRLVGNDRPEGSRR